MPSSHNHLSCQSLITQASLLRLLLTVLYFLHRTDGVQEGSETDGDHRQRGGRHSFRPVAADRVQEDAGKPMKGVTSQFVCLLLFLVAVIPVVNV